MGSIIVQAVMDNMFPCPRTHAKLINITDCTNFLCTWCAQRGKDWVECGHPSAQDIQDKLVKKQLKKEWTCAISCAACKQVGWLTGPLGEKLPGTDPHLFKCTNVMSVWYEMYFGSFRRVCDKVVKYKDEEKQANG